VIQWRDRSAAATAPPGSPRRFMPNADDSHYRHPHEALRSMTETEQAVAADVPADSILEWRRLAERRHDGRIDSEKRQIVEGVTDDSGSRPVIPRGGNLGVGKRRGERCLSGSVGACPVESREAPVEVAWLSRFGGSATTRSGPSPGRPAFRCFVTTRFGAKPHLESSDGGLTALSRAVARPCAHLVQKHPGEELLLERGHDVIRRRVRVAAGRSGVAIGFRTTPWCTSRGRGSRSERFSGGTPGGNEIERTRTAPAETSSRASPC